jgi:hypothetical protein
MIRIISFDDSRKCIWDKIVQNSKNGNFLHQRDFLSYHAHRFDEQSVLVLKDGKPIAVFPCNRVGEQIISHGGLTYAGLIYGADLRAAGMLEVFDKLSEHFRSLGCYTITYKAIPHIFHRYPAEEDLYGLTRAGARLIRRDISSVVQMANRLKLSRDRKNNINKGIRANLEIREGAFIDQFHSLAVNTLRRHDAKPVHEPEDLYLLQSRFPREIKLFGAFLGNELLAGALIFDFGRTVHAQYLANSDAGKATGALDLLLSYLLDNEFSQRQFFSFGISTEKHGSYLNEGLVSQKEGFGARGIVHDFYQLSLK